MKRVNIIYILSIDNTKYNIPLCLAVKDNRSITSIRPATYMIRIRTRKCRMSIGDWGAK